MTETELENFRDLSNQWSMWGVASLVQKVGRKWHLSAICKHPGIFTTKRAAMDAVDTLVLARARQRNAALYGQS